MGNKYKTRNLYIGSETDFEQQKASLPIGTEFGVTDGIHKSELDPDLQKGVGNVISGNTAPTTSTVGFLGQMYINTTNGKLYKCTAISGNTYTWSEFSAGAKWYNHKMTFTDVAAGQGGLNIEINIITNLSTSFVGITPFMNWYTNSDDVKIKSFMKFTGIPNAFMFDFAVENADAFYTIYTSIGTSVNSAMSVNVDIENFTDVVTEL